MLDSNPALGYSLLILAAHGETMTTIQIADVPYNDIRSECVDADVMEVEEIESGTTPNGERWALYRVEPDGFRVLGTLGGSVWEQNDPDGLDATLAQLRAREG
jgi:hypothetical protein